VSELADRLAAEPLEEWLTAQRWFASKTRDVADVSLSELLELAEDPPLGLALVEARFHAGTHELYQLVTGLERGRVALDAAASRPHAAELCALMAREAVIEGAEGTVAFHLAQGGPPVPENASVRPMGAEQSNTSVVLGDRVALKIFRRLEPGENPELEMLRFLTAHGYANIAPLVGWYELRAEHLDATLGIAQAFVGDGRDGWELALDELGADPDRFLERLHELGRVIGEMHALLGSDPGDANFAPEDPGTESMSLVTATIDEAIERLFIDLPEGDEALAPIIGRGEDVRDRLGMMSNVGSGGRLIRHHGDLHLGQTLRTADRWVILDFEGEPARHITERRRKRSPLRDVAGMLRSFAYAASASQILRGNTVPEDWEARAREAFLTGYLETVEPSLLPPGQRAIDSLLAIYELEKAVYELRYELDNRPDWVRIPVASIARLLEEPIE
jgi:trehalose synthase-fused probable maltokinase